MIPWFGEEDQGRPSLIHAWTRRAYSLPSARRRTRGALRAWATQESLNRLGVVPWIFEPPLPQSSVPQAPIWSPYSKPPRTSYVVSLQFSRCGHLLGAASTSGAVTIYPFHLSEKVWDAASEMRKRVANVGLSDHDTFFDQLPRPPYASSSPGRVLWDDEAFENEYGPTGMKARFALMKQSAVSLRLLCEQELGYGHPSPLWRNPQASTGSLASYTQNNQQSTEYLATMPKPVAHVPMGDGSSGLVPDSVPCFDFSPCSQFLAAGCASRGGIDVYDINRLALSSSSRPSEDETSKDDIHDNQHPLCRLQIRKAGASAGVTRTHFYGESPCLLFAGTTEGDVCLWDLRVSESRSPSSSSSSSSLFLNPVIRSIPRIASHASNRRIRGARAVRGLLFHPSQSFSSPFPTSLTSVLESGEVIAYDLRYGDVSPVVLSLDDFTLHSPNIDSVHTSSSACHSSTPSASFSSALSLQSSHPSTIQSMSDTLTLSSIFSCGVSHAERDPDHTWLIIIQLRNGKIAVMDTVNRTIAVQTGKDEYQGRRDSTTRSDLRERYRYPCMNVYSYENAVKALSRTLSEVTDQAIDDTDTNPSSRNHVTFSSNARGNARAVLHREFADLAVGQGIHRDPFATALRTFALLTRTSKGTQGVSCGDSSFVLYGDETNALNIARITQSFGHRGGRRSGNKWTEEQGEVEEYEMYSSWDNLPEDWAEREQLGGEEEGERSDLNGRGGSISDGMGGKMNARPKGKQRYIDDDSDSMEEKEVETDAIVCDTEDEVDGITDNADFNTSKDLRKRHRALETFLVRPTSVPNQRSLSSYLTSQPSKSDNVRNLLMSSTSSLNPSPTLSSASPTSTEVMHTTDPRVPPPRRRASIFAPLRVSTLSPNVCCVSTQKQHGISKTQAWDDYYYFCRNRRQTYLTPTDPPLEDDASLRPLQDTLSKQSSEVNSIVVETNTAITCQRTSRRDHTPFPHLISRIDVGGRGLGLALPKNIARRLMLGAPDANRQEEKGQVVDTVDWGPPPYVCSVMSVAVHPIRSYVVCGTSNNTLRVLSRVEGDGEGDT